ncbi:hypothetical protein KPH14_009567 [Odynerus spinipes]|uniref:Uncharacterized protein n=1 Tax=Odynerus spinipes TaxID=1348599 RepID=A0AAD9RPQ2_9HYME|nr:hypothetical protein KPH14_009567 [Odynerus spinipes]
MAGHGDNARNKPADGVGHVNQKGATGQKAPLVAGQKVAPGAKSSTKPAQKPTAQKGQVKVTPKAASVKTGKNKKKGQRQQYDLIVTINLHLVYVSGALAFRICKITGSYRIALASESDATVSNMIQEVGANSANVKRRNESRPLRQMVLPD